MKKLIQVSIFLFLAFSSFSQERPPELQQKLDSLWSVWEDNSQADTLQLKALNSYIWKGYMYTQPDSGRYYALQYFDFAKKRGLKKEMAYGYRLQAISFDIENDLSNALKYYQLSYKINKELGNMKQLALNLHNIGMVYYDLKDWGTAMSYIQKSLNLKEGLGYNKLLISSLYPLADIYMSIGDFEKALEYYQRTLTIHEQLGNKNGVATSYSAIGEVYSGMGNYIKAIEYYQKAIDYDEKSNFYSQSDIGRSYYHLGEYSKALEYLLKSLKSLELKSNKYTYTSTLVYLGKVYFKQGNHKKAIHYCDKVLKVASEMKIPRLDVQREAYECLYNVHKSIGNGNMALNYHELMIVIADSINSKETAKKVQQIEFLEQIRKDSLATVAKEQKIEEAHQTEMRQEEKNRNIAIAAGIFFLLIAGGFFGRWRYTKKAKAIIEKEKDRSENLLLNILPAEVAEELKQKGEAEARDYDMVSILFTDFKGFTEQSEKLSAAALVKEINNCFKAFDAICEKYKVEKIKTIGDAYMAAGGLPVPEETSIKNTVLAALEMQAFIVKQHQEKDAKGEHAFQMRVGIHTGPVVAGIVGVKKFQYDIWGDTVNTASRMESSGEVGKVNVSESTYNYLKDDPDFVFESRGKINAKGKGEIEMYFVKRA